MRRFESFNNLGAAEAQRGGDVDEDYGDGSEVIVGKSTRIDKPYLRITGRPDPESVRPEPVLRKALQHFLEGYKRGTTAYDNFISQMKSIRQDLTVQHIQNGFTVEVYEENFRVSLFENDVIQVRHCQANLW